MIKYLSLFLAQFVLITSLYGATEPIDKKAEFTDEQFREAVVLLFQAERQKQESYFARFDKSFLDDPDRIKFGNYWNDTGFNYFIIDRNKMKYEYNYMIGNWGYKIHGDIIKQGGGLNCKEPTIIRFMHMNRN